MARKFQQWRYTWQHRDHQNLHTETYGDEMLADDDCCRKRIFQARIYFIRKTSLTNFRSTYMYQGQSSSHFMAGRAYSASQQFWINEFPLEVCNLIMIVGLFNSLMCSSDRRQSSHQRRKHSTSSVVGHPHKTRYLTYLAARHRRSSSRSFHQNSNHSRRADPQKKPRSHPLALRIRQFA